jgi:branched-chain amino acid transport system substrate-binding protein
MTDTYLLVTSLPHVIASIAMFMSSLLRVRSVVRPLVFMATVGALLCTAQAQSPSCTMNAALFMPLSGPAATVGEDFRRAAVMSYEKLPSSTREHLKLIFEDTQLNATVAINAFRSLTLRERIDALVVSFAESTNALAPIADRAKLPFIGCSPNRQYLNDRPFTFRHWTDPESMSPLLLNEILRQGKRKLGLVFSEHPAMSEFAQYFQSYAKSRGVEFMMVSSVLPHDTDFRGIATQISAKSPDGVVYFLLPPQPSQFVKQYRALDKTTQLFSFVNTESEGEVAAAAGAMEGVIYVGPKFSDAFIQEFKDRHQGGFPEICSGNFYDIVQMLGAAVRSGACSGDTLRAYLASLGSFEGVAGSYGVSASREFTLNLELRTVRNGTFVPYRPTIVAP